MPGSWNRRPRSTPFRSGCAACGCWACRTRTKQIENCIEDAQKQADGIVAKIKEYESPGELRDKKVIALIAYLDKLGRDISEPAPAATRRPTGDPPAKAP